MHRELQVISWHLLCAQDISQFILCSLVGTMGARTQSMQKQHNSGKMCTNWVFRVLSIFKGNISCNFLPIFPNLTTQKREMNLSDAAWWFLPFETEGQTCESSVQSFYLMHVGAALVWDQKKGLGKQNYLDSLVHTFTCKSLIHNRFTQEESLFHHTRDS